jgi:hypothetical protein
MRKIIIVSLIDSSVTPGGVVIANYKRAGKVRAGTVGQEGGIK